MIGFALLRALALACGIYRLGPDHVVWVGPFRELGAEQPFVLDFQSGHFAPARAGSLPDLAKKVDTPQETVTFRNGEVTLTGTVTLPPTKGPHSAVVLIHGSGAEDRDYLGPWVGFFVSQGLAVLSYDKRGVRDSGGDWKKADFDDLAGDALAGVQLLRSRADVDASRIGLFGISQGGWIAPLVAASDDRIAFIILHTGSALPVGQNGLLYVESLLRGYGFPDGEIEKAMAYYRLNEEVTRTGKGLGDLQELYKKEMARGVEWILEEPQPLDHWFRGMYRRVIDFDPAPAWEKVSCPVLAFFGELDHNVPPEPNRKALEVALAPRPSEDATIVVLPKANHLLMQGDAFVDGYFSVMGEWLAKRLNAAPRRSPRMRPHSSADRVAGRR